MTGTTVFPGEIDTYPEIGPNTSEAAPGVEHDVVHENVHAALVAVQTKLGTTGSEDAASIDARVAALEGAVGFAPSVTVTASITLAEAHVGRMIQADHASTVIAITVPPNSAVAFGADTEIHIRWKGMAAVAVIAGAGVTVEYPASQSMVLKERFAVATLKRDATDPDVWALFGMLEDAP